MFFNIIVCMQKKQTSLKGIFLLLLTAFIWGTSFVAQSDGAEKIDAFTFQGIRTVLGGISLLPIVFLTFLSERRYRLSLSPENRKSDEKLLEIKRKNRNSLFYGVIQGFVLCGGANFQQFAFYHSTAGKIAFITATYMFLVPLASLVIFRKKISPVSWLSIFLGFLGLYFISFAKGSGFSNLNRGDIQAFVCAFFFTAHILCIDNFASKCDGVKLSCVQFFVSGFISLILMFIFESPKLSAIKSAALPIFYSGVMSCGVAYTLQIFGQRLCDSAVGPLAMCMESVFAVLSAAVILHEKLSAREISGCALMFCAILITQIYDIFKKKKGENQKNNTKV